MGSRWTFAAVALICCVACKRGSPGETPGTGGAGGCPDGPPEALFSLEVTAANGALPADLSLQVKWSAGVEPTFELNDPATWKSLDEGSNLECAVDKDAGPPMDLDKLACELWTSGATAVTVKATGYLTHEETFTPKSIEGCDHPVPSKVTIELKPDLDAGMME